MLRHLNIKNFAIIESLELDFDDGFTAITGETGAGKSILVDALGLLCGNRADKDWVRSGAKRAELSAEFDASDSAAIAGWLAGQELDDSNSCLVRRTLSADGGSRAYINGNPVALGQLQSLGAKLLEIHGQHGHQALLQSGEQLRLLDAWGGHNDTLRGVESLFDHWASVRQKLDDLAELPTFNCCSTRLKSCNSTPCPPQCFCNWSRITVAKATPEKCWRL
jgi:DNA repair protein RecN (Recombination protein N)